MDRRAWLATVHRVAKNWTQLSTTSLVAQTVKRPSTMWETRVRSLGQKDTLKKGMATDSSILAWKIPWTEEPGGPESMGLQRVGHHLASKTTTE